MDRRGGVAVDLRVYPTTSDRSVVRSALQYDVDELENDLAQIVQIYEVMVDGDKAFWDPEGLKIEAMEGARGFTVLPRSETYLDHVEKAPFATLHGPIPPGERVLLSVGYLLDHEGAVRVTWTPPFQLVVSSVLVGPDFELDAPGAEVSDIESSLPDKTMYTLPIGQPGTPVTFGMSGLRIRNPIFVKVGMWGGIAIGTALLLGLLFHRRGSARERLTRRRDELLGMLEADKSKEGADRRQQLLGALDQVYRQLRALDDLEAGPPPPEKAPEKKAAEKPKAEED
jgi:hypothetical protein